MDKNKKAKNEIFQCFNKNKESLDNKMVNINEENSKYNENKIQISSNKKKVSKAKLANKTIYNLDNKEKLTAYNNIYNIYDNIKKIYEKTSYKTNCSTASNFYIKNSKFNYEKNNNINKKINKKKNEAKTNKINNENVNILNNKKKENAKKCNQKKVGISSTNIIKLKKIFEFWNEFAIKKSIIKKLKNQRLMKSQKNILFLKNKLANKTKKILSATTKKLNSSNSIINQRLSHITPRQLNIKNNKREKNLVQNNYSSDKKNNQNNSRKKNCDNCLINKIGIKNSIYSSNSHQDLFKKYYVIFNKTIGYKKEVNKKAVSLSNNKENLYFLDKIIKLFEKKNNERKIKYYLNKWKKINKIKRNGSLIKGIQEKIIKFKKVNSLNENNKNNSSNYLSNILQNRNYIYQNNKTESNFPNNHGRSNSIVFLGENLSLQTLNNNNSFNGNIYKSNNKSKKIIYRKKFLLANQSRNHFIEERNLTLGNNFSELNLLNQTDNNNMTYNSIYGGRILYDTNGNDKLYNKIEEREICFTPKKNSIFKNSLGINVNIVENYLNKKNKINEIKRNNPNMNNMIKTKTIFLHD